MSDGLVLERVSWHPERALAKVEAGSAVGDHLAAESILDRADGHVPYEHGTLAGSRAVELGDGGEVAFGYTDPVAVYQHAHPEWHRQGDRSATWLEDAMDADHESTLGVMAAPIRRELGG